MTCAFQQSRRRCASALLYVKLEGQAGRSCGAVEEAGTGCAPPSTEGQLGALGSSPTPSTSNKLHGLLIATRLLPRERDGEPLKSPAATWRPPSEPLPTLRSASACGTRQQWIRQHTLEARLVQSVRNKVPQRRESGHVVVPASCTGAVAYPTCLSGPLRAIPRPMRGGTGSPVPREGRDDDCSGPRAMSKPHGPAVTRRLAARGEASHR